MKVLKSLTVTWMLLSVYAEDSSIMANNNLSFDITGLLHHFIPLFSKILEQLSNNDVVINKRDTKVYEKESTTQNVGYLRSNNKTSTAPPVTTVDVSLESLIHVDPLSEITVEEYIKQRIADLKHLLGDEIEQKNNTITTVVEFIPKETTLRIVRRTMFANPDEVLSKYADMRQETKSLVQSTERHKSLVASIFDNLTNELFRSQCNKKGTSVKNWKRLKSKYSSKLRNDKHIRNLEMVLQHYDKFYDILTKDLGDLTQLFDIKCKDVERPTSKVFRRSNDITSEFIHKNEKIEYDCVLFRVCSMELEYFFLDFYNLLKKNISTTIKNYKNEFDNEAKIAGKDLVDVILEKSLENIDSRMNLTYNRQLLSFKLNPQKDMLRNYNLICYFVMNSARQMSKEIKTYFEDELEPVESEVRKIILEDIGSHITKELMKFEKETIDSVCNVFETCNNGDIPIRRRSIRRAS